MSLELRLVAALDTAGCPCSARQLRRLLNAEEGAEAVEMRTVNAALHRSQRFERLGNLTPPHWGAAEPELPDYRALAEGHAEVLACILQAGKTVATIGDPSGLPGWEIAGLLLADLDRTGKTVVGMRGPVTDALKTCNDLVVAGEDPAAPAVHVVAAAEAFIRAGKEVRFVA
jgi:hypothetical protein